MLCVSEREIVCTRVAGFACTGVRTRVWACVCMYGYACVHGVVHVRVVVHGTLVCVGVRMLLKGIEQ